MRTIPQVISRISLLAMALLLGTQLVFAEQPSTANPCSELRVMTFNIRLGSAPDGENHWSKRRGQLFQLIARERPDLIGLQEALRFQIDEILAAVPGYQAVGVGRDDGKEMGEHAAILYRQDRLKIDERGDFWFSDTPEIPGSKSWGNQITRVCSWARFLDQTSSGGFYFFNLHLDHLSQSSREKSVVLLLERIRQRRRQEPVIVTGDFNSGESNPAVRYMKGEADAIPGSPRPAIIFRDSYRVAHPDEVEVGTFNEFKGIRTGDKIDYILVEPSATVKKAAILRDEEGGHYPSDHFPVTATVCLP